MVRPLTLLLLLITASIWLTRHAWLTQPPLFQLASQLTETLGLSTPVAKRPELLSIASHAKLRTHHSRHYQIHGQIHNPTATPLAAPSILFIMLDRDNNTLDTIHYPAEAWQQNQQPIAANGLTEFVLQLPRWLDSSWGYQIRLID